MRSPFNTRHDAPATRSRRADILASARIFAGLGADDIAALVAASSLATCPGNTVLFTRGGAPEHVFFIGSGFVQIRVGHRPDAVPDEPDDAPPLHLRILAKGDIAGDRELLCLAAGAAGSALRQGEAVVLGAPAEIVAVDQQAVARLMAAAPQARLRLAGEIETTLHRMQRLTDDIIAFRNMGKVRLARFLLELFDTMGQLRGSGLELPHAFSHSDIAAALGLTRRSIFDDIQALEDFDAIDHDRGGHLRLRDRARLCRIAAIAPSVDKDDSAAAWLADIEASLAAGNALQAFEHAREALLYHPRHPALRYNAVLAALRAGAADAAEGLIAQFGYSASDKDERIAALVARALKDRAFAAVEPGRLRSLARHAADAYLEIFRRTGGTYPAINAAAMLKLAGDAAGSDAIASGLARAPGKRSAGYWTAATRAEALYLLGRPAEAAGALRLAVQEPDADDGSLATTRRQFRRLEAALGDSAKSLNHILPVRPVIVLAGNIEQTLANSGHLQAIQRAGRLLVAIANGDDFFACRRLAGVGAEMDFVLAAPVEMLRPSGPAARQDNTASLSLLAEHHCHLADSAAAALSPESRYRAKRRALGLGILAARDREADLLVVEGNAAAVPVSPWHPPGRSEPTWAGPDREAAGLAFLLWVENIGECRSSRILQDISSTDHIEVDSGVLMRFAGLQDCLDVAAALRDAAQARHLGARLCVDAERLDKGKLENAGLPKLRPVTPGGQIFATEAAAAEIALARFAHIRLHAVGRVRSNKRMSRATLWRIADAGDAART